ncbi:MAG: type II toxin-antitoxin system antitoxin SocA domain-containing protein [Candidatus Paceibacterota bacterium]|jgi:hypothetical protein
MEINNIILAIANQFKEYYRYNVPKTKLLKLTYLAELEYKRKYNERLSDAKWVYFLYGPYLYEYNEILTNSDFEEEEIEDSIELEKMATFIEPKRNNKKELTVDINMIITNIVAQYGGNKLDDLLEYIYFETEPMMKAETRGEYLNFDVVMNSEYYKIRALHIEKDIENSLRNNFRKKLEQINAKRNAGYL